MQMMIQQQQRHYAAAPGGMRRSLVLVCVLLSSLLLLQHGAKAADTAVNVDDAATKTMTKKVPKRRPPSWKCADPINGVQVVCENLPIKLRCHSWANIGCCEWRDNEKKCHPRPVCSYRTKKERTCRAAPHCGWSENDDGRKVCVEQLGCEKYETRKACTKFWQYCKWTKPTSTKVGTCAQYGDYSPIGENSRGQSNTGVDGKGCQDLPKKACQYFAKPENGKLCVYSLVKKKCLTYQAQVAACAFGNNQRNAGNTEGDVQQGNPKTRCETRSQGKCFWTGNLTHGDCVAKTGAPTPPPTRSPTPSPEDETVRCFSQAGRFPRSCCTQSEKDRPVKTIYRKFQWDISAAEVYINSLPEAPNEDQKLTNGKWTGYHGYRNSKKKGPLKKKNPQFRGCSDGKNCKYLKGYVPVSPPYNFSVGATDNQVVLENEGGYPDEMHLSDDRVPNRDGITCKNPKLKPNDESHDCAWCPYHWESPRCVKFYQCPSGPNGPGVPPGCGTACRRARVLLAAATKKEKNDESTSDA